ncbi:MAG: AMP-binding protein [Alphaproteobacteria bacterium]|nr:AMP-binding protein [Alphaproteobacteria bacterium]
MTGHNVADALREHASTRPDAVALRFPSASYTTDAPSWDAWTYAQLDRESDAYARGFAAAGVKRGDRTLFLVKPSLDFYAALFGVFKLGAVPVLLDPGMGMKALLACIERTKPRAVIALSLVHAVRVTVARRAFASAEVLITAGSRWFWGGTTLAACRQPADEPFEIARCAANDDAAIIFTSGSTGLAKGVASRQAMFAAQVEALRQMFDFRPGQQDLQCFAAFAIFDVCLGMTSIIPKMDLSRPATARPEDIAACLNTQQPDVAFASPIVWLNTSRWCLQTGTTFPSVKTLMTVGAAIPAWLHRDMQKVLTGGSQVWTPYGATEGMPIAWIGTEEILGETWARTAKGHGTCVGRLAPGAWVRVIGIHDDPIASWSEDLALPANTLGEIVIGGDQVSPEYKDAPDANRVAKIPDGGRVLHRMGDIGTLDEQGRLWFCGRKAHRVQTEDGTVFGADAVEGIFNEHPDVFRTALIGHGPRGKQELVLCVEMNPGRTWDAGVEQALRALAEGTAVEGRIGRFLPHPGFPTDARHNSKIRREDLAGWVEAQRG